MAKRSTVKKRPESYELTDLKLRQTERRMLARANREERELRALAKRLRREMQRTNDDLQKLAMELASRARALEAERDVDRSLAGAGDGQ